MYSWLKRAFTSDSGFPKKKRSFGFFFSITDLVDELTTATRFLRVVEIALKLSDACRVTASFSGAIAFLFRVSSKLERSSQTASGETGSPASI